MDSTKQSQNSDMTTQYENNPATTPSHSASASHSDASVVVVERPILSRTNIGGEESLMHEQFEKEEFKVDQVKSQQSEEPDQEESKVQQVESLQSEIQKPEQEESKVQQVEHQKSTVQAPETEESKVQQVKCQQSEIQEPKQEESSVQQLKSQQAEIQELEQEESKVQQVESLQSEIQEPEQEESKAQQVESQQPEIQNPETQQPEIQHSNIQHPATQHQQNSARTSTPAPSSAIESSGNAACGSEDDEASDPSTLPTAHPNHADYTDASRFWGVHKLRVHEPADLTIKCPGFDAIVRGHRAVFSAYSRHFHRALECGEDFLPCGPSLLNYLEGTNTLELNGGPDAVWACKILLMYNLDVRKPGQKGCYEARLNQGVLDKLVEMERKPEEMDPWGFEGLVGHMGLGVTAMGTDPSSRAFCAQIFDEMDTVMRVEMEKQSTREGEVERERERGDEGYESGESAQGPWFAAASA